MGTILAKLQRITSKFVYEENPQVTFWKEKVEKLEEENKGLKENIKKLQSLVDYAREYASGAWKMYENRERRVNEWIENLNRMPWWKKMFYKIKV